MLSSKEKKKIGNLLKDLVPSINTSQIQEFSEDKVHEQDRLKFSLLENIVHE